MTDLWYLGAPYSSPHRDVVEDRMRAVNKCAAYFFAKRWHLFSPLSQCHEIAKAGQLPTDAGFWHAYNLGMIDKCYGLLVLCLPGWDKSAGLTFEISEFRRRGKRVLYLDPDSEPPYRISTPIPPYI